MKRGDSLFKKIPLKIKAIIFVILSVIGISLISYDFCTGHKAANENKIIEKSNANQNCNSNDENSGQIISNKK